MMNLENATWNNLKATLQGSYYGKAKIITQNNIVYLKSYETIVCAYDQENNIFIRFWSGYSITIMKHINDFRKLFGLSGMSKKEWLNYPCDGDNEQLYRMVISNGFFESKSTALFTDKELDREYERLEKLYDQSGRYVCIDHVEV